MSEDHPSQPDRKAGKSAREQRRFRRWSVSGARRKGQLRLEGREIPVQILDESAAGYSVAMPENCQAPEGLLALLHIEDDWVQVRVMNRQFAHTEQTNAQGEAVERCVTRLGLLRLRELDPWEVTASRKHRLAPHDLRKLAAKLSPFRNSALKVVIPVAGTIAVAALLVWGLDRSAPSIADLDEGQAFVEPPRFPHLDAPPTVPGEHVEGAPVAAAERPLRTVFKDQAKEVKQKPNATKKPVEAEQQPDQSKEQGPRPVDRRKQRAASKNLDRMLSAEASQDLKLTAEQIKKLSEIRRRHQADRESALESEQALLTAAEAELELDASTLAVLTPEQREAWKRLLAAQDRHTPETPTGDANTEGLTPETPAPSTAPAAPPAP